MKYKVTDRSGSAWNKFLETTKQETPKYHGFLVKAPQLGDFQLLFELGYTMGRIAGVQEKMEST